MILSFSQAVKSAPEKSRASVRRTVAQGRDRTLSFERVMITVGRKIRVPEGEIRFQFARAGGPGGQNVQKTSTKAILWWSPSRSDGVPGDVRERFQKRFHRRMTREGEVVITSQRYRDQARNVRDCIDKLRAMLEAVATPPKPRKPTRPKKGAKERRLQEKKARSERKRLRKDVTE